MMLFSRYNKTGGMISQRANFLSLINGKTPITYLFHIWSLLLWHPEFMGCYLFSTSFTLVYFSIRKVTEPLQVPYKFLTVKDWSQTITFFYNLKIIFSNKGKPTFSTKFLHSFEGLIIGIIAIWLSIWSPLFRRTDFALP